MYGKKFRGAPFGTQSARFNLSGVYPANKKMSTYTEERNLGPGSYSVNTSYFRTQVRQGWRKGPECKRDQETAWLSPQKTKVGTVIYKSFIEELEKKPQSVRGVCESREERFKENFKNCTPGPGTYGKGGIPSAALEEKAKQSKGTCRTMDFGAGVERFPTVIVGSGLGPGTYNLRTSTDLILSPSVSKRGPYDLFTGSRDKPIVYGYFAAPKRTDLNPGEYSKHMKPSVRELERPEKRKHGLFGTLDQYPAHPTERIYHSTLSQMPRSATSPGPGWYELNPLSRVENRNPPPFLSSEPRVSKRIERLQNKNYNTVGPGRYNVADNGRNKTMRTYHSSFKSQTQRYLQNPEKDK